MSERIISSKELQKHTRAIIDQARTEGSTIIVEAHGKPMAAILSYTEYQHYLHLKREADAIRQNRFAAVQAIGRVQSEAGQTMDKEEAEALVEQARQEVYQETQSHITSTR